MRILNSLLIAAIGAVAVGAAPAAARHHYNDRYDDHRYSSDRNYYDCKHRRDHAGKRGTIIGAGVGGLGTAALGGGVGESLLGAGVGAVAGNALGRGGEHRCH